MELAATKDATSESAIRAIVTNWICRYGVPKSIVSDNGKHFTSHEFKETCGRLKVKLRHSTTYHPQGNGTVERRFRDVARMVRVFSNAGREWDETLPHIMFLSRNIRNSTTGYAPSMLIYGSAIRNPIDLDGNFLQFQDQHTELARTMCRLNHVEQFVADKKLKLFQGSEEAYKQRFPDVDFQVGQSVMIRRDGSEKPLRCPRKEWMPFTGPHVVKEVRDFNLRIDKHGHDETINKTKCIVLAPPVIPGRDLRGRETEAAVEDREKQEALWKAKLTEVKKKIVRQPPPAEQGAEEKRPHQKPWRVRPPLVKLHTAADLKDDQMVLVWSAMKRGVYVARVLGQEVVPGDPKEWIKVHLYGAVDSDSESKKRKRTPIEREAEAKDPTAVVRAESKESKIGAAKPDKVSNLQSRFQPWWVNAQRRASMEHAPGYFECWEKVYAEDVLLVLQHQLQDGRLHAEDLKVIEASWQPMYVMFLEARWAPM